MEIPCAYMIALIYFTYHEKTMILLKFKDNIFFYWWRFLFIVQGGRLHNNTNNFRRFKDNMNNFGKLRWEFENLASTTAFLDLNITLVERYPKTTSNYLKLLPTQVLHLPKTNEFTPLSSTTIGTSARRNTKPNLQPDKEVLVTKHQLRRLHSYNLNFLSTPPWSWTQSRQIKITF